MNATNACLSCTAIAQVRGLCRQHYQICLRTVQAGEATWEDLVAAGKAGPALGRAKAREGMARILGTGKWRRE